MLKELTLKDFKIVTISKDNFEVFYKEDNSKVSGEIKKGADALYTPLKTNGPFQREGYGIKLVHPERHARDEFAYESADEMYAHLKYIQEKKLKIFPEIYDVDLYDIDGSVVILMEHIYKSNSKPDYDKYDWIPQPDREVLNRELQLPLSILDEYNNVILENSLIPDTSWFKANKNFIGDKIVDFHRFRHVPERYRFNSRGKSVYELEDLYNIFLERYKAMGLDPVKWYRAGMYEGFRFDNGYEFKGYGSGGKEYDSYRKLNFQYLTLANNSSVLDIGSNQGFFCFQSVVHGAKRVVGIEKTLEDYQTAVDINKNIFNFDEIEFVNGDAVPYVEETDEKFDIIIMNSVLHQIYPNFEGEEVNKFMNKLGQMTKFCMVFETPVDHPKMNLSLDAIKGKLNKWWGPIKISYVYDAYSTGYRAIFICLKT
jgi:16S rRNA G966 N2-methylase RsmD